MKKVMILGCGYIGRQIAQQLSARGVPVTGFVQSQNSLAVCRQLKIECHLLDLDQPLADSDGHQDFKAAIVLYLVPPQSRGDQDLRMRRFLEWLDGQCPARFILISTTGVYGDCGGAWVDESTPAKPQVDRARRRYSSEQQAQQFCAHNTIPLTILRVPGIYGPGKFPLERIKQGLPVVRAEDSPYSNRIHAVDLVEVCLRAIDDDAISGIYNCADGHPTTMYDYFMKVARAHGLPVPPAISLEQAKKELSPGMLSYMEESRRIRNDKLLCDFRLTLRYPDLDAGLQDITQA